MMSGYHLGQLVAPFTWIGSYNLQVLIAWLTEMLLPTIGAGKKIVLDNASFHRCQLVRKVVEAAGCKLIYLPKYSGIESSKELEKPGHLQPKIFMTLSIQSSPLYANLRLLSYIILDLEKTSGPSLIGLALAVLALAVSYWLIRRSSAQRER